MTVTALMEKGALAVQAVKPLVIIKRPEPDWSLPVRVAEQVPLACRVNEAVNIVVARAGAGFKYSAPAGANGCRYVWNGKPSCFVGQVLHQMGVPTKTLAMYEGRPVTLVLPELWRHGDFAPGESWQSVARVADALVEAQSKNDNHAPWGGCAAAYRAAVNVAC